jgi:hypothetical protein
MPASANATRGIKGREGRSESACTSTRSRIKPKLPVQSLSPLLSKHYKAESRHSAGMERSRERLKQSLDEFRRTSPKTCRILKVVASTTSTRVPYGCAPFRKCE